MNGNMWQRTPQNTTRPGHPASLRGVTQIASGVAMLVGGLVLVGWRFDIEALRRILPGFVAMNPASALAFILSMCSEVRHVLSSSVFQL